MRVLHYPPQTGPHDERAVGIGAHTECVLFAILFLSLLCDDVEILTAFFCLFLVGYDHGWHGVASCLVLSCESLLASK